MVREIDFPWLAAVLRISLLKLVSKESHLARRNRVRKRWQEQPEEGADSIPDPLDDSRSVSHVSRATDFRLTTGHGYREISSSERIR